MTQNDAICGAVRSIAWFSLLRMTKADMEQRPTFTPDRHAGTDLTTHGEFAWCFTSGLGLPVGRWLTKFEVFAWMEFGGDMQKATEHLRKVGYGGGQISLVSPQTGCG